MTTSATVESQTVSRCTDCTAPLPFHADDCKHNPVVIRRTELIQRALQSADRYQTHGQTADLADVELVAATFARTGNVAEAALIARMIDPDA